MTDQDSKPADPLIPHNDVDSNGIPILNDVVEEIDGTAQQSEEAEYSATDSSDPDTTTSETAAQPTDIDHLKETLKQELSDELNQLIQSALAETAEEISSQIGSIIENKLSNALQKQMGEMLKTALEERFKNNNSF
jgi:predicted component of type VI protein secretion system